VANLNLSVANVALPDIALDFDAGQVSLNLIAVGYSLGLAASVLYFGAIGDRYGRKLMLLLGTMLAVPMSLLAAFAPSDDVFPKHDDERRPLTAYHDEDTGVRSTS
jgi:MFS transporter, DHA2 family, multidrug resistance protein